MDVEVEERRGIKGKCLSVRAAGKVSVLSSQVIV